MRVKALDGREYVWKLAQYLSLDGANQNKSSYHLAARAVLRECYPLYQLYEEVTLPGEKLYLDFFLPQRMLAIEVHGEQHFKYVAHFHLNKFGFLAYAKRDRRKAEWCQKNKIDLKVLRHDDSREKWKEQVLQHRGAGGEGAHSSE